MCYLNLDSPALTLEIQWIQRKQTSPPCNLGQLRSVSIPNNKAMTINSKVLEWVFRLYVFIFLSIYGFGKLAGGQFYRKGQLPPEVGQLTLEQADSFSLGWTFMGHSYGYILAIGSIQLLGAFMLLFNKTKLLGTLILLPVMVNIVLLDIVFLEPKGALVNASIYLFMLLGILWINRKVVQTAIKVILVNNTSSNSHLYKKGWKFILVVLLLMSGIFLIDQTLVGFVGR